MSTVRISWTNELTDEQKEMLNDAMNVMGMQGGVEEGYFTQEEVDAEVKRLEEKWG